MDEKKILIVEDEQKIANTLQIGLAENGFYVQVAYDGKIGLRLFSANSFDLVILDLNLPSLNGYELCKAIRVENEQLPVIMLTSMNALENKIEGYNAGADDYIVKPFEFRELLLKINVLLKRTLVRPSTAPILKAAGLEMDLDKKEVYRDGKKIKLTAKEFQLLEFLLRNKNKVISRADLAINVWDVDFNTNTNVIDVYISYLRNKVDKGFGHKLIQTHIGMGYVLKEKEN